jgi:hypothetical protein
MLDLSLSSPRRFPRASLAVAPIDSGLAMSSRLLLEPSRRNSSATVWKCFRNATLIFEAGQATMQTNDLCSVEIARNYSSTKSRRNFVEKIRAHSLAPMALDSIRIQETMERKRARIGLLVVIALQDTKRPPLPSVFASGTDGNKGVVATWPLRGGKNPCLVVLGMCKNPSVIIGYVGGRVREGPVRDVEPSSAVAGAAAGDGVPAAP